MLVLMDVLAGRCTCVSLANDEEDHVFIACGFVQFLHITFLTSRMLCPHHPNTFTTHLPDVLEQFPRL
jgi:hypothetical protein